MCAPGFQGFQIIGSEKIMETKKEMIINGIEIDISPFANLEGANLRGANLQDANLQDANLTGANLKVANLTGANLKVANLEGANLRGANLEGANLRGANLRGANLTEANLRGANLDFSVFPLWCGSIGIKTDIRLPAQLAYHLCRIECDDPLVKEAQNILSSLAEKFHRFEECGGLPKKLDGELK
jgi:Pentapeptide repeats (8 copies)